MTGQPALRLVDMQGQGQGRNKGNGGGEGFDPFGGEDNGYKRTNFYTRATDGKGNSDTKYVKMSPTILGAIGELIATRQIPGYKTEADLIRDAVVHRLHDLNEMIESKALEGVLNRVVMLARVQARQTEMAELQLLIDQHRDAMETAYQQKDTELLGELLDDAEHDMEQLRSAYQNKLRPVISEYREKIKHLPPTNN